MKRLLLVLIWPLLLLACVYILVLRYGWAVVTSPAKALAMAYMLDEAANVAANGRVNTTISGRAGRARVRGQWWGCALCYILDRIQAHHCTNAMADTPRAPT